MSNMVNNGKANEYCKGKNWESTIFIIDDSDLGSISFERSLNERIVVNKIEQASFQIVEVFTRFFAFYIAMGNFFYITRHPMPISSLNEMSWENLDTISGSTLHKELDPYERVVVQVCKDAPDEANALFLTESFKIDRDSAAISTVQTKRTSNQKRFGIYFLLSGMYVILAGGFAIIPVPKKEKKGIFSKTVWQRTHFFLTKTAFIFVQSMIVIFTRLPFYKENVFVCTVLIAMFQGLVTRQISKLLPDTLYLTSFMMVKNIVSKTCSLGVATFLEFMITYCTQLVNGILTRALMPIVKRYQASFSNMVANSRWFRRKRLNFLSMVSASSAEKYERGLRSGGLKTRKAYQAAQILQKEMAVNDLYKNAIQFVAAMFSPFFTLFIYLFSKELGITTSFGQRDLIFYIMFGLVMLLFQFLFDLLVQNYVEMRYGWKLNMYLKKANEIFENRPKAWILKCPEPIESREIGKKFRSIDRMCFSSQFYFVAAHITFGCLLSVYGLMVILSSNYEIFKDDALPFLAAYTLALCYAAEVIAMKTAKWYRMWFQQGKEELEELKEIENQRKKRRGKSQVASLAKKDVKVADNDESSAFVKNKTLTMLVDDNVLDAFRNDIEAVYGLPTGLTPTEMAMRINEKSNIIKNALKTRTTQLESTSEVTDVKGLQSFEARYEEKSNTTSINKTVDNVNYMSFQDPKKIVKGRGVRDQTKGGVKSSRRGSVQWDNMETLKDSQLKSNDDDLDFNDHANIHSSESNPIQQLSPWVPQEFYDVRFIYGKPRNISKGRGGK